MGGTPSVPESDPRIGDAAMENAQTGRDYLTYMRGQSAITNQWAEDDRARYTETFQPIEDQFIAESMNHDTPERREAAAREAAGDVRRQAEITRRGESRRMASMGVDPRAGRYKETTRRQANDETLAVAGAENMARRRIEAEGDARMASVVNMGSGYAVNPATSMGLSNQASGAGFSGAIRANESAGNMLNTQFNQRMQTYQANAANSNSMFGALGTVAGAVIPFLSSKEAKTDMRAAPGILDSLKNVPVEKWKYKDGMGDGGEHVGPYAEDFTAATGLGDGKSINPIDAFGVVLGAVRELNDKVDKMSVAV